MRKKERQMPEQWKRDYCVFTGGLDQTATPLTVKPGRVSQSLNWEQVFGVNGYRTIRGFERYDGRPSPSACNYAVQSFDAGTVAIAAGNIVTGTGSASALVVSVTLTSGSWAGGNAAGTLILTSLANSWADNAAIQVGGVTRALAAAATLVGSPGYADNEASLRAAREALRALIEKPPGEGPILGLAVYNEAVYAVRAAVGLASAALFKSSSAGWVTIKSGLHASGNFSFEVANFTGNTTDQSLYGVGGGGRLFKVDASGAFSYAAPIFSSECTSVTSFAIGLGSKAFTFTQTARNYAVGNLLTVWSSANAANSMSGIVTAFTATTVTINVTSFTGAGTFIDWEIGLTSLYDKPTEVDEHKNHLFLVYPRGQLQTSNLGDPMTYTTTAALFGLGDEITNLTSLKGEVLGIFCREKIALLRGTSSLDWELASHTKGVGAVGATVQDNAGNAIFLDDKGVTTLQATQSFGDFESSILSSNAKSTLDPRRDAIVGSRLAKSSNQYRLYFDDGLNLRFTINTGNAIVTPADVGATLSQYPSVPQVFASGKLADGLEHLFFGDADGYVMEEDAGTSFDGAAITYVLRPHFNHFKSPYVDKRFHKAVLEIDSADAVQINFRQLFDYDNGTYTHGGTQQAEVIGTGGQFDDDAWDTFAFDLPLVSSAEHSLNGVGSNMTLLYYFESDYVRPVTLQGQLTFFSVLGMKR